MPNTMPNPDRRTQPNALRSGLDGIRMRPARARIDPNSEEGRREILAVIQRTKAELGLSQKAMAITAGITESELSDALNAKENRRFDVSWLYKQDDAFLLKFITVLQEQRGLTPESATAIRRRRIVELIELLLVEAA